MDETETKHGGATTESYENSPVSESDSGVASGISCEDISQTGAEAKVSECLCMILPEVVCRIKYYFNGTTSFTGSVTRECRNI